MIDIFSVEAIAELGFDFVIDESEKLYLNPEFCGVYSIDDLDNIDIMPLEGFHSVAMALPSHTQAGVPIYVASELGLYLKEKGIENRIYDMAGAVYENGVRQLGSWLANPPEAPQKSEN